MNEKVLICARSFQKLNGLHSKLLQDAGFDIVLSGKDRPLKSDELAAMIPGITAVITGMDEVTEEVITVADELKVISMNGVGLDRIDVGAATRRGIVVTHTPGTNADSVADLALGLILAQARHIPQHDSIVRSGGWFRMQGRELHGRVLGLVGLGNIGKGVARRASAFGMHVKAYDPFIDEDWCVENGVIVSDMEEVLTTCDIVSLHCPVMSDTECLINRDTLARMKRGAVLINTSRGELVDEEALAEALKSGQLSGAGLDVFSDEPPVSSPLFGIEQTVLTPHLGGNTHEAALNTAMRSARNVVAILRGGVAFRVANPEVFESNNALRRQGA